MVALAAFEATTGVGRHSVIAWTTGHAIAEFPSEIQLGSREIGEIAVATFMMTNRGAAELIIDSIRTNCSCVGLERNENGTFTRIQSLSIPAGESRELAIRIAIRGPAGKTIINGVMFRTNDPKRPEGGVTITVSDVRGGIEIVPTSAVFGRVLMGSETTKRFAIRNPAHHSRSISGISSSNPAVVTARLLTSVNPAAFRDFDGEPPVIAHAEITLHGKAISTVREEVRIHLAHEERQADVIPVVGQIVAPIEVTPRSLSLPLSSTGGPVYTARYVCRAFDGKPFSMVLDSKLRGVLVEINSDQSGSAVQTLCVTVDPKEFEFTSTEHLITVRLRVSGNADTALLEIPLTLLKDENR